MFFDDGHAGYRSPLSLRLVCKSFKPVWHGVETSNKDFIERYLTEYPWRKMVKLKVGDSIKTKLKRTWVVGEVTEVDASLAEIKFEEQFHW